MGIAETTEALKISPETVHREWKVTKAWLYGELTHEASDGLQTVETSR